MSHLLTSVRVALVLLLAGCGAAQTRTQPQHVDQTVTTVEELSVIQVAQRSELFEAQLVFRTGYRDVSPPALLTLLAWSLESSLVSAQAELETFTLSTFCEAPEACIARLADTVAREVSAEAHAALLQELRITARQMRADSSERALTLAVSGALEKDVSPWAFAEDPDALSRDALIELARSRFVRQDALVLLSGPFENAADSVDLSALLARLGTGTAASVQRDDLPEHRTFAISDAPAISFVEGGGEAGRAAALRVPADRDLNELARRLVSELGGEGRVYLNQLRDGQMLLVTLEEGDARALLQRALEGVLQAPAAESPSSDPVVRWLRRDNTEVETRAGLALICQDGQGYDACTAAAAGAESESLSFNGEATELHARGTIGGAFFAVERRTTRGSSRPSLALFFEGGSAQEPTREHGRHALLSSVLAARCGGRPMATPSHFGVTVELSSTSSSEHGVSEALFCLAGSPSRSEWLDAKARLVELVRASPERSWLVDAVSPESPGWVLSYASEAAIAGAHLGPWVEQAMSRLRARVAVVGDVDVAAVTSAAELALAEFGAGEAAPSVSPPPFEAPHLAAAEFDSEVARVVLAFHTAAGALPALDPEHARFGEALAARRAGAGLFARGARDYFESLGLSVRWTEVAASHYDATVSISLAVPLDLIESLPPAFVAIAALSLGADNPQPQDARALSMRLAIAKTLTIAPSAEAFDALAQSEPTVVIGRAQSEAAMRRYH